jgi:REP-associated tyrosine transposase
MAKGTSGNDIWEHFIRDDTNYQRHVDYVHVNPLKHGCVTRLADWPYAGQKCDFHHELA